MLFIQAVKSIIGEVFDDVSFEEFEEDSNVSQLYIRMHSRWKVASLTRGVKQSTTTCCYWLVLNMCSLYFIGWLSLPPRIEMILYLHDQQCPSCPAGFWHS